MAQEKRGQKITLIAGVSVVTQKLLICTVVCSTFSECSVMDTGIVVLPSLIFETCFVKTMKYFETLLEDIFKSINQSASFKSSFSGVSLNLKT